MDVRTLASALNGEVAGRDQVLAPGPGHGPRDRSLSVRIDPGAPNGFLCHSFAGDDWRQCRDHVRRSLGLAAWEPEAPKRAPRRLSGSTTTEAALALWERSTDPHGTIVEDYLVSRALRLPAGHESH
jgi:hypothetical protein